MILFYILLSLVIGLCVAYFAEDEGFGVMFSVGWPILLPMFLLFSLFEAAANMGRDR
jgi:hypothetical protein